MEGPAESAVTRGGPGSPVAGSGREWPSSAGPSHRPAHYAASDSLTPAADGRTGIPPSPACFVECGGSGQSTPSSSSTLSRSQHLTAAQIPDVVEFGSEDESSDDEASHVPISMQPTYSARLRWKYLTSEEVDEEDSDTADVIADGSAEVELLGRESPSEDSAPTPEAPRIASPAPQLAEAEEVADPENIFDFHWESFPNPPIAPAERREAFTVVNCGPTRTYATPYEAFVEIWDRPIMQDIANETNRYAREMTNLMTASGQMRENSRLADWKDTDVDEVYVLFAIILGMGMMIKSRVADYWAHTDPKNLITSPGFAAQMTRNRFQLLCRCLHFDDNVRLDRQTSTRAQAKLFKLQPVLDHLNRKFSTLYVLSQNISLDESHVRNKAAVVKTYELCESRTGYLWRFEVHAGPEGLNQEHSPIAGPIYQLVFRLLGGLEGKGYTVWMDNYHNSPALARYLKRKGFDVVGTLRTNQQLVPSQVTRLLNRQMTPGQIAGCTSGDVDIVVWRDKKRAAMISTYHGVSAVDVRGVRKPSIIADYNICMGGVGKKEQLLAAFPIERKRTKVWYKQVFMRMLNASTYNAYLLYANETCDQSAFRQDLLRELLQQHRKRPIPREHVVPGRPLRRTRLPADSMDHWPCEYPPISGSGQQKMRRKCVLCSKRTTTYCPRCNVALCAFTCGKQYHS